MAHGTWKYWAYVDGADVADDGLKHRLTSGQQDRFEVLVYERLAQVAHGLRCCARRFWS